jgi:hypothetical protein
MTFNVSTSTGTHRVVWVPYLGVTGTATYTYTTN